jgi:hypothetical protein
VPVGVPRPGAAAAMVAVNMTVFPTTAGLTELASATATSSRTTTWDRGDELADGNLESPL